MRNFTNELSSELTFQLPELSNSLELTWQCDVVKDLSNTPYDMIIGRDVLKELKIDVLTSDLTVTRKHIKSHGYLGIVMSNLTLMLKNKMNLMKQAKGYVKYLKLNMSQQI